MYDFDETIRRRRSIRGFIPTKPVPDSVLSESLGLAQQAPSNCNVQPWKVFVAKGDTRDRLSRLMCAELDAGNFGNPEDPIDVFSGGYKKRQIECAAELYGHMGVKRDDHVGRFHGLRRNFEFFDAPQIAIICMEQHFGIGVALDVGMYVQTLMLALHSRGIGSCAQASMRHYPDIVRRELGIRQDLRILCGVAFGYEDKEVPANRTVQSRNDIANNVVFLD
jgi:nitroreductase